MEFNAEYEEVDIIPDVNIEENELNFIEVRCSQHENLSLDCLQCTTYSWFLHTPASVCTQMTPVR